MNPADLLVAAAILLIVGSAVFALVREKRSGRKCYGCDRNCGQPKVISIDDGPEKGD